MSKQLENRQNSASSRKDGNFIYNQKVQNPEFHNQIENPQINAKRLRDRK